MHVLESQQKLLLWIESFSLKKKKKKSLSGLEDLRVCICSSFISVILGQSFFSDDESGSLQREACCKVKHVNNAEGMSLNAAM